MQKVKKLRKEANRRVSPSMSLPSRHQRGRRKSETVKGKLNGYAALDSFYLAVLYFPVLHKAGIPPIDFLVGLFISPDRIIFADIDKRAGFYVL